jgi:glyceraldehyde-3-phosphate dehydrogenase type I
VHGVVAQGRRRERRPPEGGRSNHPGAQREGPGKLPWKSLGVDVVLEATGKFTDRDGAARISPPARAAVLISAPAKGADLTFVFGVNESQLDQGKHHIVSIGSCTTNCLAPVAKVLNDTFGIEHGLMTTIHAYTNDQTHPRPAAQGSAPGPGGGDEPDSRPRPAPPRRSARCCPS